MAAQPVESQPLVLAGDCAVKIVFRLTEDQVNNILFVHVKNSFTFFSVYCSTAFSGLSRLRHNFAAESSAVKQGASDSPQGSVQFRTHLKELSLRIEHISPTVRKRLFCHADLRLLCLRTKGVRSEAAQFCIDLTRTGVSPKLGIPPYFTNLSRKNQIAQRVF